MLKKSILTTISQLCVEVLGVENEEELKGYIKVFFTEQCNLERSPWTWRQRLTKIYVWFMLCYCINQEIIFPTTPPPRPHQYLLFILRNIFVTHSKKKTVKIGCNIHEGHATKCQSNVSKLLAENYLYPSCFSTDFLCIQLSVNFSIGTYFNLNIHWFKKISTVKNSVESFF